MPSARDPEAIYRFFGRRLRELRERKHVPQEELAALSGLTRSSIANIESGRQRVLLHQLLRFAEALNVEIDALVPHVPDLTKDFKTETRDSKNEYLHRLRIISARANAEKTPE